MATINVCKRIIAQPLTIFSRPVSRCHWQSYIMRRSYATMHNSRFNNSTVPSRYKPPTQLTDGYVRFKNSQKIPFYKSPRVLLFVATGTVLFGGYYVTHLEKVPISGRLRFMDITKRQEEALAMQAYQQLMTAHAGRILPPNHYYSKMVRRVAERLVRVSGMEHMHWEFHVVESREANAVVLPGGKVFVYTGILPICKNEDGLAAVLGHEIAHELARHTAERFSHAKVLFAFNFTLSLLGLHSIAAKDLAINYLMELPFSRKCETEADDIGLQLMSLACFDPREAVELWKRMEAAGVSKVPQFFNTHPSHESRMKNLSKKLPAALQKSAESDCYTEMKTFADHFRETWVRW